MPTTETAEVRNPNALPADGTFQGGRLPAALATDYVQVDEYEREEWVNYVRRLAAYVTYFDDTNAARGNWEAFYRRQPAVVVARLLTWPLGQLGRRLDEHRELIEDTDNAGDAVLLGQLLGNLFDLLSSAVLQLDALVTGLANDSALHLPDSNRGAALIRHQLAPAYRRWLSYYLAGRDAGLFDDNRDQLPDYLIDPLVAGGTLITTQQLLDGEFRLSRLWTEDEEWGAYAGAVTADTTVYGTNAPGADAAREIVFAVGHVWPAIPWPISATTSTATPTN